MILEMEQDEGLDENQRVNNNNLIGWAVIIVAVACGVLLINMYRVNKECEDRALEASVEAYPINEYPDTNERARLQGQYEQRYIQQSCQGKFE